MNTSENSATTGARACEISAAPLGGWGWFALCRSALAAQSILTLKRQNRLRGEGGLGRVRAKYFAPSLAKVLTRLVP